MYDAISDTASSFLFALFIAMLVLGYVALWWVIKK